VRGALRQELKARAPTGGDGIWRVFVQDASYIDTCAVTYTTHTPLTPDSSTPAS
jgi:hypothetical protein